VRSAADLLEPQIPSLRRYAYALTRNHASADDLVQDTLERALTRWTLRGADLRPWLFAVLRNLFLDGARARQRRPGHKPLDDRHPGPGRPPEQDGAMLGRDMLDSFAGLSEEHRSVLLLVAVEGLSYAAAAQALGVPTGTVMSRLSRAREQFRRLLDGEVARPHGGDRSTLRRVK